ncbi:MAG: hypothetical protein HY742_00650 [Deltaproteobacteria bacterium]|nr:hypothetical protein [Deltaproteobacteria bacterium]
MPLISNLDVYGNIALIRQCHEHLPTNEARRLVEGYLRRYALERIASKRDPALTDEERFRVMLLRAIMVKDPVLVINQPFKIMHYGKDLGFFDDTLKVIDDSFKECYIFDLTWNKDRYRMSDAP